MTGSRIFLPSNLLYAKDRDPPLQIKGSLGPFPVSTNYWTPSSQNIVFINLVSYSMTRWTNWQELSIFNS